MQFARTDLVRTALRLLEDGEVWIPGSGDSTDVSLCNLRELGQVGSDRRDVWDGFEPTDSVTAYPMVENHDTTYSGMPSPSSHAKRPPFALL